MLYVCKDILLLYLLIRLYRTWEEVHDKSAPYQRIPLRAQYMRSE